MGFVAVLVSSLQVLFWHVFRQLFLAVRYVAWRLNGVAYEVSDNQEPNSYKGTAHVQSIWFRHKMDLMIQPAVSNNFITVHHSFRNPECVLSKNVTLYTLTRDEAIFVESAPGTDATLSKYSSFFRIAQFTLAQRLIVLPIHVFHQLADKLGDPKGKLIFLTNTSRCGSTLLTQVFEETGHFVALSEPDAMYAVSSIKEQIGADCLGKLTISTVRMLCKPTSKEKQSFVIKLSQQTVSLTHNLVKLFPQSKHIFMYRRGLDVAKSVQKMMLSMPYLEFILCFGQYTWCMNVARAINKRFGFPNVMFEKVASLHSPLYCGGIVWASAMDHFLTFKRDGLPVVAVRYEDMTIDAHYALKQIFDYCGLDYQADAVDRAFSRDSQENSPISRAFLKQFKRNDVVPEELTKLLNELCDIHGVPHLHDHYIAEDTITLKHKPHSNGLVDSKGIAHSNGISDSNGAVKRKQKVLTNNHVLQNSTSRS